MPLSLDLAPADIPPPITQEELNQNPVGSAIDSYLYYRYGSNTMQDNYDLLEPLPSKVESDEKDQKPALTICMPVAINQEDETTIARALDAIGTAQQKFGRPVDLVLWANAKYTGDKEQSVSMDALINYQSLRNTLTERQSAGLRIRTALQLGPEEELSIGQIRANYMEAVALDVQQQGLGYDHPVMWMDADTIDISDKTFAQVVEKVQSFEELFVHPMTHYGIDWANGHPLSEADAATKAVAIDEIMRRQRDRNAIKESASVIRPLEYHEENGLAFAIGTYLSAGGLPVHAKMSESMEIINAVAHRTDEARRHYANQYGVNLKDLPPQVGILPEYIAKNLTKLPRGVLYLPGSYATMAARKQNSRVRSEGPNGLRKLWTHNYRDMYVDETNTGTQQISEAQIASELPGYIANESLSFESHLSDQQKVCLGNLVLRYFGEGGIPQSKS